MEEKNMGKSEKEKMLSGDYYSADDEGLVKERDFARNLTFEFNHTRPSEKEERQEILRQLIKAKGQFHIEAPFNCDYGYNIEVGENFYANYGCTILDVNKVKIGDNVTIGAGSVVTKDIPDNVIAAGNPCRVIKCI
jgi:maltose O-acetyltransferase